MADKSPDAYRTISEAGAEAGLPAHVLRFWESKFTQLKPVKRAGGRRLYRPQDVALLKGLRRLLYDEGYTIKGVQKYLKEHGVAHVSALGDADALVDTPSPVSSHTPAMEPVGPEPDDHTGPAVAPASEAETRERLRAVQASLQTARDALAKAL